MKKTLIALAAVAVSGAAFAQVSLTGAFSVSLQKTATDGNVSMAQTDGALTFGATEDLGGGLKFTGSQTFSMTGRSGAGVTSENFSASLATASMGTFAYSNVEASQALLGSPVSLGTSFADALGPQPILSMVKYTAPTLVPGLGLAWASYSVNAVGPVVNAENFFTDKQANAYTVSYATGALSANVEWRQNGNHRTRVQVGYDAGFAKLAYRTEVKVDSGDKQSNFTLTAPVGAVTAGLFYGMKGDVKGTEASVSYALSKRTAASLNFGKVSGSTAATNGNSYRVKLAHSF
jgi:hypothetical protein